MVEAGEHLDEIDRVIARELVADGRATLAHLAATAGLSVSAVQSRVRRLESRGVVAGYSARINPEAVGKMLSAFVAITPLDLMMLRRGSNTYRPSCLVTRWPVRRATSCWCVSSPRGRSKICCNRYGR